eukprot:3202230-Rhodomonas_salina.1
MMPIIINHHSVSFEPLLSPRLSRTCPTLRRNTRKETREKQVGQTCVDDVTEGADYRVCMRPRAHPTQSHRARRDSEP